MTIDDMQGQAEIVRQFNRFYTVHLGLLRGRYLDSDFSLSEGRLMYELSLHPETNANALRTTLGLDAGYTSRLLRSLSQRALVQGRRAPQDKRSTLLSLTEAGQAAVADLNRRTSAETVAMLARLGTPERDELLAALVRVRQILAPAPGARGSVQVLRALMPQLAEVTSLLHEYFDVIGIVLRDDAQAIAAFLNEPASAMWIAYVDGQPAGCVALRPLPDLDNAVECKRLYVRPAFQRRGLADALMQALEAHALDAGYDAVYLDTKDDLHAAIQLYHRLGYTDCPRYNENPQATVFMRKSLA